MFFPTSNKKIGRMRYNLNFEVSNLLANRSFDINYQQLPKKCGYYKRQCLVTQLIGVCSSKSCDTFGIAVRSEARRGRPDRSAATPFCRECGSRYADITDCFKKILSFVT